LVQQKRQQFEDAARNRTGGDSRAKGNHQTAQDPEGAHTGTIDFRPGKFNRKTRAENPAHVWQLRNGYFCLEQFSPSARQF
jgi:hypothetical protein